MLASGENALHFAETHLAEAVATTGRDGFAVSLVALVGGAVAHDAAALLLFRDPQPPAVLVDRLKPGERQYLYSDYLSGVYLLSPFHRAAKGLKHSVATRVKDVAPPGFTVSEYHRRYFSRIGVSDMLGLLLPCGDGTALFLSLSRSVGRFGPAETRNVSALLPVIDALVTRTLNWRGLSPRSPRHVSPRQRTATGSPPARAKSSHSSSRATQVCRLRQSWVSRMRRFGCIAATFTPNCRSLRRPGCSTGFWPRAPHNPVAVCCSMAIWASLGHHFRSNPCQPSHPPPSAPALRAAIRRR